MIFGATDAPRINKLQSWIQLPRQRSTLIEQKHNRTRASIQSLRRSFRSKWKHILGKQSALEIRFCRVSSAVLLICRSMRNSRNAAETHFSDMVLCAGCVPETNRSWNSIGGMQTPNFSKRISLACAPLVPINRKQSRARNCATRR